MRKHVNSVLNRDGSTRRETADCLTLRQVNAPSAVLLPVSELENIHQDWADLAQDFELFNPFLTPEFLGPALKNLQTDNSVKILTLYQGRKLIGLLPVELARGYAHTPFAYLKAWQHCYAFLDYPLIRKGYVKQFIKSVRTNLSSLDGAPKFLRLNLVPVEAALVNASKSEDFSAGVYCSGERKRPAFIGKTDIDAHINACVSPRKRRDISRLLRRLSEKGKLRFDIMQQSDDYDHWCQEFLALEDKGWKGEMGTSLASTKSGHSFFCEMLQGMAARGDLIFHRMSLDDKAIAMSVNFLKNGEGFGFKSCYDESYAVFSPGVLATLNLLSFLSGMDDIKYFDTCSSPGQSMLERYWPAKLSITGVSIGSESVGGNLAMIICKSVDALSAAKFAYLKHRSDSI